MKKLILVTLFLTAIACQKKDQTEKPAVVTDEHSFAKPELAVVKHLDLDIKVDFETQTISGKASWQIDNVSKGNEIIFDENTLKHY
jgi:leukotriene-A4 hydrolase